MSDRPAWSHESALLPALDLAALDRFSPEWALDGATGDGVRVAVVDSGIEASHPMLDGCIDEAGGRDFSVDGDGQVVVTEGPHDDVFGHGTACAGIIHALAPRASITSVRVLGPGLRGKAAAFHAGLEWAVAQEFDVINLSLGAGKRDWALAFHEVCDRAYFSNSFIVTAANNIRRASFPSLYASVTSVACNTTSDPLRFQFNPEPPTEFLARGIDVEVPWLDGETTVTTGNSFAAPHIAGFAALIRSKHPELRPFHVKAALWACAANVRDRSEPVEAATRSSVRPAMGRSTMTVAIPALLPDLVAEQTNTNGESEPSGPKARPIEQVIAEDLAEANIADIGELLADGSWGSVYSATGTDGEALAVRRVDRAIVGDASQSDRFIASVRAAAEIDHPHVLDIYELVETEEHALLVMPQAPSNLGKLERPTSVEDACAVAISILGGLDAAHRHGVFHGDLRPRNVLIDHDSRVMISDVGIAAPLQANARRAAQFSAAEWRHRAPEQILGQAVGGYTDVFAAGSVVVELLTGSPAYPAATGMGDLVARASGSVRAEPLPPELPGEVAASIGHAIAVDPAYRWARAADFRDSLLWAAATELGADWLTRSRFVLDPTVAAG